MLEHNLSIYIHYVYIKKDPKNKIKKSNKTVIEVRSTEAVLMVLLLDSSPLFL